WRLKQFPGKLAQVILVLDGHAPRIEYLPGERLLLEQFLGGILNQVAGVMTIVVPIFSGTVDEFADQNRRPPLGKKEEGKTRRNNGRPSPRKDLRFIDPGTIVCYLLTDK